MSGLIKQFVGILGVLMIVASTSYAQNAATQPVQNEGAGALSSPNQSSSGDPAVPANNAAPSAPNVQPAVNANSGETPQTAPTTTTPAANAQPQNATVPAQNNTAPSSNAAAPNSSSVNDNSSNNNLTNTNNGQTLPPINGSQGNNAVQQQNNSVAQPLPPINNDANGNVDANSGQPVQGDSAAPISDGGPAGVDASTLPHDLSPYGMFMQADWVVKSVMIGLAAASLLTWIIFVAKTLELGIAKAKMRSAVRTIVSAQNLTEVIEKFSNKKNVSGRLVNAAANEVRMSINAVDGAGSAGIKERVTSALSRIEAHAGRRMAGGSAILATIGSISPFVGLFGTVWGIMNAFIGISKSQVTNLAVVAPGIAEALLATAIGLVAAIPAVVIYNYLAKSIVGYRQIVTDASTGIERLVSRDLDFREAQKKSPRTVQPLAAE